MRLFLETLDVVQSFLVLLLGLREKPSIFYTQGLRPLILFNASFRDLFAFIFELYLSIFTHHDIIIFMPLYFLFYEVLIISGVDSFNKFIHFSQNCIVIKSKIFDKDLTLIISTILLFILSTILIILKKVNKHRLPCKIKEETFLKGELFV